MEEARKLCQLWQETGDNDYLIDAWKEIVKGVESGSITSSEAEEACGRIPYL